MKLRINITGPCAVILGIMMLIGWCMNFQNLWEYWPESSKFVDISMNCIMSIIGVFIVPFGAITGWIF